MIFLYILLGIIAVVYLFFLYAVYETLADRYKNGIPIKFVVDKEDLLFYLFFPLHLLFIILSYRKRRANMAMYKKNKQSALENLFAGDMEQLLKFEGYIKVRCGTFFIGFYSILDKLNDISDSTTATGLYNLVKKVARENDIYLTDNQCQQAAFDLLSGYFERRYDEPENQRILRLRKAGYAVRINGLGRDESKHTTVCKYESKEDECPDDCNSCVIKLKTDADICLQLGNTKLAIEKYEQAVAKDANFAEAWNNLATAYGCDNNHSAALKAYLKAAKIDPLYGNALWGAATALKNLGREAEALYVLQHLLTTYKYEAADKLATEIKNKGITSIRVCKDFDSKCYDKISDILTIFGIKVPDNYAVSPTLRKVSDSLFLQLFSPFFDYIVDYFGDNDKKHYSTLSCSFMLLAGMAAAKLYNTDKNKVITEGMEKLLASPKGFFAMDEYCCDYLGIRYIPDDENAFTPCIDYMITEAINVYTDVFKQINSINHIKAAICEMASVFFYLGFCSVDCKMKKNQPIIVEPNKVTKRQLLKQRLKSMAKDPAIKTEERSSGAMCYSIRTPQAENYKCSHCGRVFSSVPDNSIARYFKEIFEMGYDCKLEHWCKRCCENAGLKINSYSESRYVFYIRLESNEQYRRSTVYAHELETLYQFFKNENKYSGSLGRTCFVGESADTIERLLGIKL